MLSTWDAVQDSELFLKGGGIAIERTSIEGKILLSTSGVCGFRFYVQQYRVLFVAGEHCAVEMSNAYGTSRRS